MLHSLNLLPWREALKARHRRRFFSLVVLGVLLAGGVQWGAGAYFDYQKGLQQQRLDYLNRYIASLDKQIDNLKQVEKEHSALLTRLSVVEELQQQRNKTTDFMNLIPAMIPQGVYVDKIKMNGQQLEVSGISDTTSRLATMLDNLEKSSQLSNVEMHSIVLGKQRFGKQFQTFHVSFSLLNQDDANRQGAQ
ncbi:PilN domain-containing protein [Vibrio scophthalmi]|uniref:PilN domain-containing protein n=1 Tax=Vibrio scophthalmi TaxID=45658 RepID=UPI002FF22E23